MNGDFTTVNGELASKTGPFSFRTKKPRYFFVSTSGGTDLMIRLYTFRVRNEREWKS